MEATGFGVMHVDADDRIIDFLEKPADPPGMPDKPEIALASMGIYVFETEFLFDQLRRDADDPNSSHDFGKDIIPYLVKHGKAVAHRFPESCVRSRVGEGGLLARRRHDRRLLGGQHRPHRLRAGARPLRPATGRSGPTPRSRRRPSSSTTRTAGAAWRSSSLVSGGCIDLGLRGSTSRCCSPACTPTPTASSRHVVALPYVADPPRRAAQQGGDRPRRRDPAGPRGRRGPGPRRPALPPHRQGRLPDHQADDRPPPDLTRRPRRPDQSGMEPRARRNVRNAGRTAEHPRIRTGRA